MVQVQAGSYANKNIFGAYLLRMRTGPGWNGKPEEEKREKERERELFEVVDDYIEQA